jgi:hypothetical protein
MTVRFWSFCHPEPGPELDSGSIDFGISVLGLENLGFKAPPCGRGSLLSTIFRKREFYGYWIIIPNERSSLSKKRFP